VTTSVPAPELPESRPSSIKKKRVLLVDSSPKRDLRAEAMRKVGVDVDCAADVVEARCWWKPDLYDLVLISAASEHGRRDKFCGEIRNAMPSQRLAFLVGKPEYLAASPNPDEPSVPNDGHASSADLKIAGARGIADNPSERWGIMEACQRMSVVRSAFDSYAKAMRERPAPKRDSEVVRGHNDTDFQVSPESAEREPK